MCEDLPCCTSVPKQKGIAWNAMYPCAQQGGALRPYTAGAWDAGGRAALWTHCRSEVSVSYLFSIVVFYAEIFHSLQGELNYS